MFLSSFSQNKYVIEAQAYPYTRLVERTELPITITEVSQHVRIDALLEQESYLETLMKSAINIFETYTNLDIIKQKWGTYRDPNSFIFPAIELRKPKFVSLDKFEYLKDDIWTPVDSDLYYIPLTTERVQILLKPDKSYPHDIDNLLGAIKIEFTAGLTDDAASLQLQYNDIKTCLFNMVAWLYENRGNNDVAGMPSTGQGAETTGLNALPNHCWDVIHKYKDEEIFDGFFTVV